MSALLKPSALIALCLVGITAACATSHSSGHIGDRCDLPDGGVALCPAGSYCARATIDTRTCQVLCDGTSEHRCASGEACIGTSDDPAISRCFPGGERPEGADCTPSSAMIGGPIVCGRGLWCAGDLGAGVEFSAICEPVCDTNADCLAPGERCIDGTYCAVPCSPADPASCPTDSVCKIDRCIPKPRAANCEYVGEPDCPLGQICQARLGDVYLCKTPVEYLEFNCGPGTPSACIYSCTSLCGL
jgi:hypothetical protein